MGGFFSLRGDTPKMDEHAEAVQPATSTPAAHIRAEATAAAEAEISTATRKRGRPRKTDGANASDNSALQGKINEAISAQLDQLHDPKLWAPLMAMPAYAAQALTGNKDRWELEKEEKEYLGLAASTAARTMMITNPRALAFTMLAAAVVSVYGPRAVAQFQEMAAKKRESANVQTKTSS